MQLSGTFVNIFDTAVGYNDYPKTAVTELLYVWNGIIMHLFQSRD